MNEQSELRLYMWLALCSGLTTIVLLAQGLFGANGMKQHQVLRTDLAELRQRSREAEREHQRLQSEERALRQEPQYVEWVIRQELGWVRADELILIADTPGAEAASARSVAP